MFDEYSPERNEVDPFIGCLARDNKIKPGELLSADQIIQKVHSIFSETDLLTQEEREENLSRVEAADGEKSFCCLS